MSVTSLAVRRARALEEAWQRRALAPEADTEALQAEALRLAVRSGYREVLAALAGEEMPAPELPWDASQPGDRRCRLRGVPQ